MQLVAGGPPFVLDAGDELIDLGQRRRVAVPLGPVLGHQDPEQGALGLDGPNPTVKLVANSPGSPETRDYACLGGPILPRLQPIGSRREFATSVDVGVGPGRELLLRSE